MILLQSPPHPALQHYIVQYVNAVVDNAQEFGNLKQLLFPIDTPGLCLYFPRKLKIEHEKITLTTKSIYTGLVTSPVSISFPLNEQVKGFMVSFRPYGFADLFKINSAKATDQMPDFFSISGREAEDLYAQLEEAPNFEKQVQIADNYFLKKLPKYDSTAQINAACKLITESNGLKTMKAIAYETNMSLSTLERQFINRVGVSPKTFSRFKRFHYVLSLLYAQKPESLLKIAHQCGYFDQAHFIKEFEDFTHMLPSAFNAQDHPVFYQFILKKDVHQLKK